MGGTCVVREEPRKQNTRSCRAQELARSSAKENGRKKKGALLTNTRKVGMRGGHFRLHWSVVLTEATAIRGVQKLSCVSLFNVLRDRSSSSDLDR